MKNLFTTEPQRTQRNDMTLTAETQRRRGINVGAGLAPAPDGATARVAPTKVNLRWAQSTLRYLLIMTYILTLLMVAACGGGGGGGSSTSPSSTITFSGSSSGYNVYMAQNTSQSSGSVLAVDIMVSDVNNVYGAAFDVDFDSSKMTYSSDSAGSFLESDDNSVIYEAALQSDNSGKLIVVAARQGSVASATGNGTVVTLKFNVTGGGSVSFSNSSLVDSSGSTISSASWSSGGTVSVL